MITPQFFLTHLKQFIAHRKKLSLESALKRYRSKKLPINTVIDVGASNGIWSIAVKRFFPKAYYFLIEANRFHKTELEYLRKKWGKAHCDFILAAAGDTEGEIYFDNQNPFGGLASHKAISGYIEVPVKTIDSLVKKMNLKPPFLIKLDTHGFEVPIFEGAAESLKKTNLIIVETYNFDIAPGSLRFPQMCQYLEKKGFRCIDMCDPMFRTKDDALWQFDLFFILSNHAIFQDTSYE